MNSKDILSFLMSLNLFGRAVVAIAAIICLTIIAGNLLKHWSILFHGWPPPHCDANGDATQWEQEKTEEELELESDAIANKMRLDWLQENFKVGEPLIGSSFRICEFYVPPVNGQFDLRQSIDAAIEIQESVKES